MDDCWDVVELWAVVDVCDVVELGALVCEDALLDEELLKVDDAMLEEDRLDELLDLDPVEVPVELPEGVERT